MDLEIILSTPGSFPRPQRSTHNRNQPIKKSDFLLGATDTSGESLPFTCYIFIRNLAGHFIHLIGIGHRMDDGNYRPERRSDIWRSIRVCGSWYDHWHSPLIRMFVLVSVYIYGI